MGTNEALLADKRIKQICDTGNELALELGQLLRDMRDLHGWNKLGYPSFDDYIRARFNRRLRWAQDKIQTADILRSRPALREASEALGATKTRIIAQAHLGPEGEAVVLNAAPHISTRDLAELAHQEQRKARAAGVAPPVGDGGIECPSSIYFSVFPGQKGTIDQALGVAGKMAASSSRGHQLEMVSAEFLATYNDGSGQQQFLDRMLGAIGLGPAGANLVDLLPAVEWMGEPVHFCKENGQMGHPDECSQCPCCSACQTDGHTKDCDLALAIKVLS